MTPAALPSRTADLSDRRVHPSTVSTLGTSCKRSTLHGPDPPKSTQRSTLHGPDPPKSTSTSTPGRFEPSEIGLKGDPSTLRTLGNPPQGRPGVVRTLGPLPKGRSRRVSTLRDRPWGQGRDGGDRAAPGDFQRRIVERRTGGAWSADQVASGGGGAQVGEQRSRV